MTVRALHIGEYPGEPVGSLYESRAEAMQRHVHTQSGRGIDARKDGLGAGAICPSGGYVDDHDNGDWILYTGQGGQDSTRKQVDDQSVDAKDNAALIRSFEQELPVRVLRGNNAGDYAPAKGYRYDGLYWVDDYWFDESEDGPRILRFLMVQMSAEEALPWVDMADYPGQVLPTIKSWNSPSDDDRLPPPRRGDRVWRLYGRGDLHPSQASVPIESSPATRFESVTMRLLRDSALSRRIKAIHDYRCQVCGIRLETAGGPYVEGAHIRGLGDPHNGPDTADNLLCLCPNHHTLFDGGGLYVADDYVAYDRSGTCLGPIRVDLQWHMPAVDHLAYHRHFHNLGS